MTELRYAFLRDSRCADVFVFANQDDALADLIVIEHGFDGFVYLADAPSPAIGAEYRDGVFIDPEPIVLQPVDEPA